jgi:hypothetical protein
MRKSDFLFSLFVSEVGLAEGKNPPLCDGCGNGFDREEDGQYKVIALILDGLFFHSIQCEECVKRYFSQVRLLTKNEVSKEARQTVRLGLAQEMEVC